VSRRKQDWRFWGALGGAVLAGSMVALVLNLSASLPLVSLICAILFLPAIATGAVLGWRYVATRRVRDDDLY
jgi:hypothetical protein